MPITFFEPEEEQKIAERLYAHFGREEFTPGLDRVRNFFHDIIGKCRERGLRVITVAGTNGKGETSHVLAQLLSAKKYRVALWTSPHILSICERIVFENENISYQELNKLIDENQAFAQGKLSYYEFLFYLFCLYALDKKAEVLVLEVGLGGRLDAVNIFDAEVAAITSVSRDHQAILGNSYREILLEKIAVARPYKVLLTSLELEYCREICRGWTQQNQVKWQDVFSLSKNHTEDNYSKRNRTLAYNMLNFFEGGTSLQEAPAAVLEQDYILKGRSESWRYGEMELTFVGSHNVDGIRKLYQRYFCQKDGDISSPFDTILLAFSVRPIKDIESSLMLLSGIDGLVLKLTKAQHPKAFGEFDKLSTQLGWQEMYVDDWKTFLREYRQTQHKVLVTGSFYFVGEVQSYLHSLSRRSIST